MNFGRNHVVEVISGSPNATLGSQQSDPSYVAISEVFPSTKKAPDRVYFIHDQMNHEICRHHKQHFYITNIQLLWSYMVTFWNEIDFV